MESIQELEALLKDEKDIYKRVDVLNRLAWELRYLDLTRTEALAEEARQLSTGGKMATDPYEKGLAHSLMTLGFVCIEKARFSESVSLLMQALPLFGKQNDQEGRFRVLNMLGNVYSLIGDYPEAMTYYLKSLELAESSNNKDLESVALHNIGYVNLATQNYQQALEYFFKSLPYYNNNKSVDSAYAYENIAHTYFFLKEYEKGLAFGLRALEATRSAEGAPIEVDVWNTLGELYEALGNEKKALECFQEGWRVAETKNLDFNLIESLRRLGALYCRQGRLELALETLQQAHKICDRLDARHLHFQVHLALAETYKRAGNFHQALIHFEAYHRHEKEVFNERSDLKLRTLEVMHRVEDARKEAEIYQLKNVGLQKEIEERKKVQAMLEELAVTDSLTGLYNRRHFFLLTEQQYKQSLRYHKPLSIILLDLDHFKQVNDHYGHHIGDMVLITIARAIKKIVRGGDIVGRYGGEEFIILLPETDLPQAEQAAERLRQGIADCLVETSQGLVGVTSSLGVAILTPDDSVDSLVEKSDQALYQAKSKRNRVAVFGKDFFVP